MNCNYSLRCKVSLVSAVGCQNLNLCNWMKGHGDEGKCGGPLLLQLQRCRREDCGGWLFPFTCYFVCPTNLQIVHSHSI